MDSGLDVAGIAASRYRLGREKPLLTSCFYSKKDRLRRVPRRLAATVGSVCSNASFAHEQMNCPARLNIPRRATLAPPIKMVGGWLANFCYAFCHQETRLGESGVEGLARDAELRGDLGLPVARCDACPDILYLLGAQAGFPSLIASSPFG